MNILKVVCACVGAIGLTAGTIWAFSEPASAPIDAEVVAACSAGKCGTTSCPASATQLTAATACRQSGKSECCDATTIPVSTPVAKTTCCQEGETCSAKSGEEGTCKAKCCDEKSQTEPVAACDSSKSCDAKTTTVQVAASTATCCKESKCKSSKDNTVPVATKDSAAACCKGSDSCQADCCKAGTCEKACCKDSDKTTPVSATACATESCEKNCQSGTCPVAATECCKDGSCERGGCKETKCKSTADGTIPVSADVAESACCKGSDSCQANCCKAGNCEQACCKDADKTASVSTTACATESCEQKCPSSTCPVAVTESVACCSGKASCESECCKDGSCEKACCKESDEAPVAKIACASDCCKNGAKCSEKCKTEGECKGKCPAEEGGTEPVAAADCPNSSDCKAPCAAEKQPVVADVPHGFASVSVGEQAGTRVRLRIGFSLKDGPVVDVQHHEHVVGPENSDQFAAGTSEGVTTGCEAACPTQSVPAPTWDYLAHAETRHQFIHPPVVPYGATFDPMAQTHDVAPVICPLEASDIAFAPSPAGNFAACPYCPMGASSELAPFPHGGIVGIDAAGPPKVLGRLPLMAAAPPSAMTPPMAIAAPAMEMPHMMPPPVYMPQHMPEQLHIRGNYPVMPSAAMRQSMQRDAIQSVSFEGDAPIPEHVHPQAMEQDNDDFRGAWVQTTDDVTIRFYCEPTRIRAHVTVHETADHPELSAEVSGTCSVTPDGQIFGVVDHFELLSQGVKDKQRRDIETGMIDQPFSLRFRTDGETLCLKDFKCGGMEWLGNDNPVSAMKTYACGEYVRDTP